MTSISNKLLIRIFSTYNESKHISIRCNRSEQIVLRLCKLDTSYTPQNKYLLKRLDVYHWGHLNQDNRLGKNRILYVS